MQRKFSILKLITIGSNVLALLDQFSEAKEDDKIESFEIVALASSLVSLLESVGVEIPNDIQDALANGDVEALLNVVGEILNRAKGKVVRTKSKTFQKVSK